jgi:ribonuclease P/MRP protein subunit POP5
MVWAALSFVTRLPKPIDDACVIQVVRVSGTIKKSEEEAIRRARLAIVRAQRSKAGPGLSTFNVEGETGDADHAMANGIEDSDGQDEDDD